MQVCGDKLIYTGLQKHGEVEYEALFTGIFTNTCKSLDLSKYTGNIQVNKWMSLKATC